MRKLTWIILALMVLMLSSCKTEVEDVAEEPPEEIEVVEETETEEEPLRSYLSGLPIEEEKIHQRPIAVMMDNHPNARWQCHINEADLVYEIPVEGTFTRYMALFLVNEPDPIGSVRSARPYFVDLAHEYQAVYVHAGGSEAAKALCRVRQIVDIDAIIASPHEFWRVNHKYAPHNLYTNTEVIREFEARGEVKAIETIPERFIFKASPEPLFHMAKKIVIQYFSDNQTVYEYDEEEKTYQRFKDGEAHVDEIDEKPLVITNIIVQKTSSRVLDGEGRLAVDIIGEGEGYLFRAGTVEEIKWSRPTLDEMTKFTTADGELLTLVPGQTWIQVVDQLSTVEWEGEESDAS